VSPKSRKFGSTQNLVRAPSLPPLSPQDDVKIVAIGASAGGIEALTELRTYLPPDTGMAFVLIQHLDPRHHSILTELLAKKPP
jgi:two-component system, chemotaxis family, CheB/CheR fusion protein